ncbi:MAG: lipocalin-like domain-containing protein [Actinomycetota bacterium]|nr:lipocalin-like domain-containing protein [Actinomycetota bacterium]
MARAQDGRHITGDEVGAPLRSAVLGAWELVSFVARDARSGVERHPLGTAPRGLILYTEDGFMSAQLAASDMTEYVAYGGRFAVDEQTAILHHEVMMSMMPELLARPQFRHATVDGETLTLSATTTDEDGTATQAYLVWRRARTTGRP